MPETAFGPDGRRTAGPVPSDATSAAIAQFRAWQNALIRAAREEARLDYMLAKVPPAELGAYVAATEKVSARAGEALEQIGARRDAALDAARTTRTP